MKVTLSSDEYYPFYTLEKTDENYMSEWDVHFEMPDEDAKKYFAMAKKIELMQDALDALWLKNKYKAKDILE